MSNSPEQPLSPWSEWILRRQVDRTLISDAIERLRGRRKDRTDVLQFEEMEDASGRSVLVAADQLLLRSAALTHERGDILGSLGLEPMPVAGLDDRVQLIRLPADRRGQLKETHALLRQRGVPVSFNAITPMGSDPTPTIVWKSLCTPEPIATPFVAPPAAPQLPPVRVAVVDTGISAEQRTDGWLLNLAHANGDNVDPLDDFPVPNGFLDLGAGHGTFVAGIIQRIAPAAQLQVWRALDSDGLTDETTVASMMVAAARDGADLLNLSFGAETFDNGEPPALATALELIRELERTESREIVVVAAAGNSGSIDPAWPAAFPEVVAVAALTPALKPARWSSRGPWVDCSAFGENVVSTYVQGREDAFVRYGDPVPLDPPDEYGPNSWAIWSGSSFAAPYVTGRIARLTQEKDVGIRAAAAELLSGPRNDADFGVFIK